MIFRSRGVQKENSELEKAIHSETFLLLFWIGDALISLGRVLGKATAIFLNK